MSVGSAKRARKTLKAFGIRNKMTLKSALQDVRETTLAAVSGLLGKLRYLASLRRGDGYQHWGMALVHGDKSSDKAIKTAHGEVLSQVLRTPISALVEDLQQTSEHSGQAAGTYVEGLQNQFERLLPPQRDGAAANHLNSVLVALSALEKRPGRATRSVS